MKDKIIKLNEPVVSYETEYGELLVTEYNDGNSIAVVLQSSTGDEEVLSINLNFPPREENQFYVDTTYVQSLLKQLEAQGVIKNLNTPVSQNMGTYQTYALI